MKDSVTRIRRSCQGGPAMAWSAKGGTWLERFWVRSEPEPNSGCWLWTGNINPITGYGHLVFYPRGKSRPAFGLAHRVAYEIACELAAHAVAIAVL